MSFKPATTPPAPCIPVTKPLACMQTCQPLIQSLLNTIQLLQQQISMMAKAVAQA